MNGRVQSILFLAVVGLIFIGFIFSIIYIITLRIRTLYKMENLAKSYNWKYYENDKSENSELADFITHLTKTFYNTRSGLKHKIFHIINGEYKSINFWSAYYHASSINKMSGKGYEQSLTIYVLPKKHDGLDLFLLKRTKIMKMLPVEKITELTGNKLEVPDNPELDWLYVSDRKTLEQMNLTSSQYEKIKENFKDIYGIYFLDGIIVYMIQNHRNAKAIVNLLDNVYEINSLINN